MKKARVSVIKDNMGEGCRVPTFKKSCEMGQWVDEEMSKKGHVVDHSGVLDMPEYRIDNKTRKSGSAASHTVGSMTIPDIVNAQNWEDTRLYQKCQNQNQITWDPDFMEISKVKIVDMDIDFIQEHLSKAFANLRDKVIAEQQQGVRSKTIRSDCGWAEFDGYGHKNSYRMRIPDRAMKKICTVSSSRDSFKNLFEYA